MAASRHECSICMDSFKNPKLISCHHSFCYKCLEDYVQVNLHNGYFNCPICSTSIHLPDNGISGFQTNFYIDTDMNEKFPCEICGPKSIACSRCLDCEENLCQTCCYVHEKSKGTRHHKISDLVTLDSEMKGKIRQRVFCDQHPEEEIKLVCQDCKVTSCLMCKAVKHDTHPTKALADVAAEVKMTLDTKLNQCSDKLRRIKASTVKGDELDGSINDAEQEELKAIDDQCSQLHRAIDQEAAKFKDKIKNVYRLLKEQNALFQSYMQEEFRSCSNTKDIAQNLRDKGTDIEIIKKGPDIEQLISEAIAKTDPKHTIRVNSKLFSPSKIIASKLVPLIGILQDSTDAEEISRKEREERERKEKEEMSRKEREKRERKEREERENQDREDRERKEREERGRRERDDRDRKEREEREKKEKSQKMETRVKALEEELSSTRKQYEEAKAKAITVGAKLSQAETEIHALRNQHADAVAQVNRYKKEIEKREKKEKEEREKKEREQREKKEREKRQEKERAERREQGQTVIEGIEEGKESKESEKGAVVSMDRVSSTFIKKGVSCSDPKLLCQLLQKSHQAASSSQFTLEANCLSMGLELHGETPADGNCFFEAVSSQLRRLNCVVQKSPQQLRQDVVDFMRTNRVIQASEGTIHLDSFICNESFDVYCSRMAMDSQWADHVVVVAMARMLEIDIMIVTSSPSSGPENIIVWVVGKTAFQEDPILLGHVWESHYMSLQPINTLHQTVLNRCQSKMMNDLNVEVVMMYIQEKELFDDVTIRDIKQQTTTTKAILHLIDEIKQRDQDTYERFKECLIQAQRPDLKIMLEEEEGILAAEIKETHQDNLTEDRICHLLSSESDLKAYISNDPPEVCIKTLLSQASKRSSKESMKIILHFIVQQFTARFSEKHIRIWAGEEAIGPENVQTVLVCFYSGSLDISLESFFDLKVIYRDYYTTDKESALARAHERNIGDLTSEHSDLINEAITINGKGLFAKHSNLEAISSSGILSSNSKGLVQEPCVILYCRVKGIIPFGEMPFPKRLKVNEQSSIAVDVREGYFSSYADSRNNDQENAFHHGSIQLMESLRMGCSVGPAGRLQSGTIGPFVQINSDRIGFLTCAHVVYCQSELIDLANITQTDPIVKEIVQPPDNDFSASHYQYNHRFCGKVLHAMFRGDWSPSPTETFGIDAAVIEITSRFPNEGAFVPIEESQLDDAGFSLDQPPKFDTGHMILYPINWKLQRAVIKIGSETGLTRGLLRLTKGMVKYSTITGTQEIIDNDRLAKLEIIMDGLMEILPASCNKKPFCSHGDSGAGVFLVADDDNINKLICLGLLNGTITDGISTAMPIDKILTALHRGDGLQIKLKDF